MPKLKKRSEAQKRKDARERRRIEMDDPLRREVHQKTDADSHRIARLDPIIRTQEKVRDAEAHRKALQDPRRREAHQQTDAEYHRIARLDPIVRTLEKVRDAEAHRKALKDPGRREVHQKTDAETHRKKMQDPQRRQAHRRTDASSHRKKMQDQQRREAHRRTDASSHRKEMQNPQRKRVHSIIDAEIHRNRRKLEKSQYERLLEKYNDKIKCAPSFICSCCGGLYYQESTSVISKAALKTRGCNDDFIKSVLHVSQLEHRLCSTCKTSVNKNRVPRLALSNGFDFPDIPAELKDLSPLEERLVALRLPFMQIRLLGSERQSVLRGNVVNVENDLDVCAQVLPRRFDETSTVQVQLMRRLNYKSPHWYETIRPLKVFQAAKYLINSELYKAEDVSLSEDWSLHEDGNTINFICSENESSLPAFTNNEEIENDEEPNKNEEESVQTLGAEETLVFRGNDLSFCGVRIAPGEGKTPIPMHLDLKAEILSFPCIYGGEERKFKENVKISYTDISRSEARRYDRRACNPTKLLYSFKKSFNEKVQQAVQICLRKNIGKNRVTAKDLKTPGFIQETIKQDGGFPVFKQIRTSPPYWKEKQKKVLGMVRQLGQCTFFITFSAAETKWTELLIMLMKINHKKKITEEEASSLSFEEKADLIRSDPVTCMRHFDHRFRALLNLLLKPEGGIFSPYQLQDFFSRFEFQMRGSPHAHGIYWIKDAPVYVEGDEDSEQACVEFINKFITCERCEEGKMENLIGYQIHKHSKTCEKKLKKGIKCRFSFPKPPMKSTMIVTPFPKDYNAKLRKEASDLYLHIQKALNEMGRKFKEDIYYDVFLKSLGTDHNNYINAIRSSIKRTKIFLKRSTNAIFVNPYNRQLLEAWGANIDVQFIVDTYACAKYCVGYILKSEGGVSKLLQAASADVRNGNNTISGKLKKFANILINGSEISSQEAAAFVLGIPNTVCSRQDVFINTALPEGRIGLLKSKQELDTLPDDSEDICVPGLINHYSNRPKELEDICFAEFASMYEFRKTKTPTAHQKNIQEENEDIEGDFFSDSLQPADHGAAVNKFALLDSSGHMKKRNTRKVIRFRHYSKLEDKINYNREQLMLFIPWRNEFSELLSIDPIQKAERLKQQIIENSKQFYCNRAVDEVLNAILKEVENDELEQSDSDNFEVNDDLEDIDIDGLNIVDSVNNKLTSTKRFENFLPPRLIDQQEYANLMRSLNEKQRRFVLDVLHLVKTSDAPFNTFLSGGAGVGKSQAITAIVQSCLAYYSKLASNHPEQTCVLVSAPTGKAAFNVFGMTLHCTFRLPPNQYSGKVCNLEDGAVNTLRVKLAKVKLFIIDEISMVSVKQLYDIDQRLKQIYSNSEDFGGRSVIVVGHLRQLPPVAAAHVFKPPHHLPLGACVGNYLWEKFTFFELEEIMRQRGEVQFCKALNNMSEGKMDKDDIALLKSREISTSNKPPINAIRLFKTNMECQIFNTEFHKSLGTEGALSTAFDRIEGKCSVAERQHLLDWAKKLTPQQSDGLPYMTNLQVGAEYFVTTNIDVVDGLFNGSTGCLKRIDYAINSTKPIRAWMDFRNPFIGANKRSITKSHQQRKQIPLQWVAVDRITKSLKNRGKNVVRKQIPLVAANGMTIAKSQGCSIPSVVVSVKGKKLTRELLYVACSRATSCDGLFIDGPFQPPAAPEENDAVSIEMDRMRTNPLVFTLKFLQDYNNKFVKLFFHNVQSFVLHHLDIFADQCALASDFLAFVEPHLLITDKITLTNFKVVHRSNCVGGRNSKGALILARKNTSVDKETILLYKSQSANGHCLFVKWAIEDVIIIMVYKHPEYSKICFISKFEELLQNITGKIIVIGDININLQNVEGQRFKNMMENQKLKSNLEFEDASTNGGTHIDVCFSNFDNVNAWFYESYFSYHKPICVIWPKCM